MSDHGAETGWKPVPRAAGSRPMTVLLVVICGVPLPSFSVECIGRASGTHSVKLSPTGLYAEKLLPQPQVFFAFGLLNENPLFSNDVV